MYGRVSLVVRSTGLCEPAGEATREGARVCRQPGAERTARVGGLRYHLRPESSEIWIDDATQRI